MSATATVESSRRSRRLSREAFRSLFVELRSPPNLFTAVRLVLVFMLWGFALRAYPDRRDRGPDVEAFFVIDEGGDDGSCVEG